MILCFYLYHSRVSSMENKNRQISICFRAKATFFPNVSGDMSRQAQDMWHRIYHHTSLVPVGIHVSSKRMHHFLVLGVVPVDVPSLPVHLVLVPGIWLSHLCQHGDSLRLSNSSYNLLSQY